MSGLARIVWKWIDHDWPPDLQRMKKPKISFYKKEGHHKIEMMTNLAPVSMSKISVMYFLT